MVRIGIIGFAVFLLIILVFLRMSWQVIRHARENTIRDLGIYIVIAFLSYCVVGLAEPLFWGAAPAIIFYILLAMMTVLWFLNHDKTPQPADHDAAP
jgi:undecaprenyl pyrophosphate phosphatase UppP